jgi:hypothetical protein
MTPFEIQYDLYKGDRDDYEQLYKRLERLNAVRVTESTWVVASASNADQIRDYLAKFMHPDDVLSVNVLAVGQGYAWRNLSRAAAAWMAEHLKAWRIGIRNTAPKRIGIRKP